MPDKIDVTFLCRFRSLINSFKNKKFVIVCGGGALNRQYNAAALQVGKPSDTDLDWIGIRALALNAELVRVLFGRAAYAKVVDDPNEIKYIPKEKIIVAAAFAPGRSSDYDAVLWARRFKAKTVINLSNIPYVYTADPQKSRSAKPVKKMKWTDYIKIVGKKWSPRLSSPFDPIASQLAERLSLRVLILEGRKISNVRRAISGSGFEGSMLEP